MTCYKLLSTDKYSSPNLIWPLQTESSPHQRPETIPSPKAKLHNNCIILHPIDKATFSAHIQIGLYYIEFTAKF